jgi:hypothetical protein
MTAGAGRATAWIDPAEDGPEPGREDVRHSSRRRHGATLR